MGLCKRSGKMVPAADLDVCVSICSMLRIGCDVVRLLK